MIDRKKFFDNYKAQLDPTLTQEQVKGLEFLLTAFENDKAWKDVRHIAYALATVRHETADTYQPIYEYGPKSYFKKYDGRKDLGNVKPGDGYRFRGAGFVQITGRTNYTKYGIADTPEKAIEPDTAFTILSTGMIKGTFTGKKLSDYIKGSTKNYREARRIINGLDKADLIANYAEKFEKILRDAKGSAATPTKPTDNPPKDEQTTNIPQPPNNPVVPLVTVPQPVIEVPQVVATTTAPADAPQEDGLTKIGNKATAFWTSAGATVIAIGSFLTSTPLGITISLFAVAGIIVLAYLIINWRRNERAEQRKEADKIREHELKIQREKQAADVQRLTLESAMRKDLNAVTIAPPPATQMESPQEAQ